MPSTFTPNLSLELQATGENNGQWGIKADAVFSQLDLAFGTALSLSVAGNSDVTLTTAQSGNFYHTLTGTLTGNINYIFPASVGRFVCIDNQTSGAFAVTAKSAGGTGIAVPQGKRSFIYINSLTGIALNLLNALADLTLSQIASSGVISAAAWTTNGLRVKYGVATATDTSTAANGTVATAYIDAHKAGTIAATNAGITYTTAYGCYFEAPLAGTNVTLTNAWALGADSLKVNGNVTWSGNVLNDLLFTDATYDIGKTGATRPRDIFASRNVNAGGTITAIGGSLTALGTLAVRDTSAAFDVTVGATSSAALTAGRSLTVDVANASSTLKITANATLNQDVSSSGNPIFRTVSSILSQSITNLASGTAQTLYDPIGSGMDIVYVTCVSSDMGGVWVVIQTGIGTFPASLYNRGAFSLTMSGAHLQLTQTSGAPQSFGWTYLHI